MTYDEAKATTLPEWPEWLSPEVAAKYLDTWRFKGKGPAFKRVGQRMVRYRRSDLEAFMKVQS